MMGPIGHHLRIVHAFFDAIADEPDIDVIGGKQPNQPRNDQRTQNKASPKCASPASQRSMLMATISITVIDGVSV